VDIRVNDNMERSQKEWDLLRAKQERPALWLLAQHLRRHSRRWKSNLRGTSVAGRLAEAERRLHPFS